MADIKDVAKLAGVSISTVSNVMTGKKTVSPALEERVLKAVKELGYHASPIAQGMRNSRTNTIGVVISSFQRVFFGPMLKGIQDTVSEAGCVMNVLDSGGSLETEKRCVKYLVATKADGIIMESLAYDSDPKQEKYVKGLNALGNSRKHIPVVLLEHKISAAMVDTVMVDNRLSARKAVEHLIGCGRREIAHIVGPDYVSVSRMRLLGYQDALKENGIPFNEKLVVKGDFLPLSGYQAMRRLFQTGEKISAVFAANDQMAIGAIRAIQEAGKAIPGEIAVAGFDNIFPSTLVSPPLTTVRVPNYDMGVAAAKRLLQRIEGKAAGDGETLLLGTELIVRGSTSPEGDNSWDLGSW